MARTVFFNFYFGKNRRFLHKIQNIISIGTSLRRFGPGTTFNSKSCTFAVKISKAVYHADS
jgi:hypothetical protein